MASKRHLRRKQCEGKNRFAIMSNAVDFNQRNNLGLGAYKCQLCGYWHLGHTPRPEPKDRAVGFAK